MRPKAGNKIRLGERLPQHGNSLERAVLGSWNLIFRAAEAQNSSSPRLAPGAPDDLPPVNPGHFGVDDEEGRAPLTTEQREDSLEAILGQGHPEAFFAEDLRHQLAAHGIVVNDQRGWLPRVMNLVHWKCQGPRATHGGLRPLAIVLRGRKQRQITTIYGCRPDEPAGHIFQDASDAWYPYWRPS